MHQNFFVSAVLFFGSCPQFKAKVVVAQFSSNLASFKWDVIPGNADKKNQMCTLLKKLRDVAGAPNE